MVPVLGGGQKDLGQGAEDVQLRGAHHSLMIARKNRICIVKPCFLLLKYRKGDYLFPIAGLQDFTENLKIKYPLLGDEKF